MGTPIGDLRDNFEDNSVATAWNAVATGSAAVAETGGQARFTLPSSIAGTHVARYSSRSTYDLSGGVFSVVIGTMVSTAVAATAFFQLYKDGSNTLQWIQLSGTLYARSIVAGVSTDHYSVAWNATTYKYLRIVAVGGNTLWESSSDGVIWTTRATVAGGSLFDNTALYVDFGATCGNVASPGSFRLDEVNLIALATNWRWQQAVWPLTERIRNTTIAIDAAGTAQGYLVTADGVDVNGDPSGNVRYWSGPADGGRLLTEQASQVAAEAMAVNLPLDGRFDLATMVEGRCFRLYDRSIDGAAYTIREFYPRRLVQADDIEAESIRALHIASASITGDRIVAGTITADLITVDELAALAIDTGSLSISGVVSIDSAGGVYQGTGTFASPTTGLKIFNSGGVGKLSTYNATVEQVTLDTDGVLKAGAGAIRLDADGMKITPGTSASPTILNSVVFQHPSDGASVAIGRLYARRAPSTADDQVSLVRARRDGSHLTGIDLLETIATISIDSGTAAYSFDSTTATFSVDHAVAGGINVGTATGAGAGQVRGSGYLMASDAGALPASGVLAMGYVPATPRGLLVSIDNGTYKRLDIEAIDLRLKYQTTNRLQIDATGIGAFNVTPVGRQSIGAAAPAGGTGTAAGGWDTAANRNAAITLLNNIRTALINLGWCQT